MVDYGAPFCYNYINAVVTRENPSTVHVANTNLTAFFRRYLLQRAMSVFKWKLPETWNKGYFLYTLYSMGYVAVVKTDKFGVIPQHCSLSGYTVQYAPRNVLVSNPLIRQTIECVIDINCTLFRLQPDYGGLLDIVNFYADMMSVTAETAGINIFNSKLSYAFAAKDKAAAESFKKGFDQLSSGNPMTVFDKNLYKEDGTQMWQPFDAHVGANYIGDKLMGDLRRWEQMFDTEVGIPNANLDKKERMSEDEVNFKGAETATKVEMWLEELQESAKKTNAMFGTDISVKWRVDPREGGDQNGRVDTVNNGSVSVH